MVRTIKGGVTLSSGDGANELVGEALGISDKKPEEVKITDEEQSMQKKIVKLLADGKADRNIRDMVGCSDGQLQVIKMYLGDIKDKVKIEEEKAIVVEEKVKEEEEVDDTPKKVWDPFETGVEKKKNAVKKVKLVPAIWDPLSPDKPRFVEVPIEDEPKPEVVAEEAVREAKIVKESEETKPTTKELIIGFTQQTGMSVKDIAERVGVSESYVRKIKSGL